MNEVSVTNLHALVIDDSKAMRIILGRMLRELGLEVSEAGDGREGLSLLASGLEPTLILVDWNMPEMTGIEFVEAVRHAPYESTAKVIMVTTETELPQVQRALESGADEYVMKPFTREAILEKIQLVGLHV
jgi:two-component system chemotaxis response regulator CheY